MFGSMLDLISLVLARADPALVELYESQLVDPSLWAFGDRLRSELQETIDVVLQITQREGLMDHEPLERELLAVRSSFTDPVNVLQAVLMKRAQADEAEAVQEALKVTVQGVAAGMQYTG